MKLRHLVKTKSFSSVYFWFSLENRAKRTSREMQISPTGQVGSNRCKKSLLVQRSSWNNKEIPEVTRLKRVKNLM